MKTLKNRALNAGPTYGSQQNIQAADIAFDIHTQVDSAFYDTLYPDYEWYNILKDDQVMSDVNAGATSYAYITRNRHGAAAFIGSGQQNDIPMVGQSAGAVQVPIAYSAVGAIVTNEDARQYKFGFNGNLAEDLGAAMRAACDNLVESTVIFGNKDLDFKPWIDYPGLTVFQAASNGASGGASTKWADKTGQQIVRDVNAALTAMWKNSRTLFKPTTIFLPLDQYALITELPIVIGNTGTATTVIEFLATHNIMYRVTGKELEFIPSRYLSGAGQGGTDRMVIMERSKANQCMPFPLAYTLTQPMPDNLAVKWFSEQKFGSYHVRQQGSMAYVDGI